MGASEAEDLALRRHLSIQKGRFWLFVGLTVLALLLRATGGLHISLLHIGICVGVGFGSIALMVVLYTLRVDRRLRIDLAPLWMAADLVAATLAVHYTGDFDSPWYVLYLCNTLGSAFNTGSRYAYVLATASTLTYLALIRFTGGTVEQLYVALARMMLVNFSIFVGLRGIIDLQRKRAQVSQLKNEESRKVGELTRLTQALDERTQALHEANLKIRAADRHKSQFLANMSHELRTPLNSIIGFSEILSTRLGKKVDAKEAKFLQNINASGTHLLALINDILDLSKIEAGKMELHAEPFHLMPLVDGVLAIMKGVANEKHIRFEVQADDELPEIEADPGKVKQILYNLLSNAVKFSPKESTVTLRLHLLRDQGAIELQVRDQGIGIDAKDHEAVFQEFHQVDGGAAREAQGTGLGLALVKKFVKLHRGTITVESALGQGATFTVKLPLGFIGQGEITVSGMFKHPQGDPRRMVLVVEDDPTAYERMEGELSRAHFRPLRAHTGEEALKLARSLRPDAITLDLVLPGMSGFEVLKALKQDPGTRDIPVIIVSLVENHELGIALGADGYFAKPVDVTALAEAVRKCLPGTSKSRRLLVIDDDPQVHELLDTTLLASNGYTLEHARSGPEGIAQASFAPPDLVILDLMMEGMDGFEVAARIKAQEATAHIPILVLTNKDLSALDRERLSGKIGGLLQKVDTSTAGLIEALRDLLGRHDAEVMHG
jgi:signal transduction histidine kinase/CheY-like chemotaxis protein